MAVTFQGHQLVDGLGAEVDHLPHIVAGQIHQHDVLGALLRVLRQLGGQAAVVRVGPAPSPGPGDRPRYDPPVSDPDHGFGRGTYDRQLGVLDQVHVRAGVDLAERAVEVQRLGLKLQFEALRQHDLENVPGVYVLPRRLHRTGI